MKRMAYILSLSAIFLLSSCKKYHEETINIEVLTKGITDIAGNTAIGHGSTIIDDKYAVFNDSYIVAHYKNGSFYLSVKGKGLIVSTDSSSVSMQIASCKYHGIEGFFDSGDYHYFAYSYTSESSKSKVFIPISLYGIVNSAFGCYLSDLQFNTKYYARAFAHFTFGPNKRDYVYESHGEEDYIYGEIIEFETGSDPRNPDVFVAIGALKIGVMKEDLPSTTNSGLNAIIYVDHVNFDGGIGGYKDWRLPTLNELREIYKLRDQIGNFKAAIYWSSKIHSEGIYYYYFDFANNSQGNASLHNWSNGYIRLVRPLP